MQFKNIARALVCVSMALADHSAFACPTGSLNFGKLLSSYSFGGKKLTVTVEDTSAVVWNDVAVLVQCFPGPTGAACPDDTTFSFGTVLGGEKLSHTFAAPPQNFYLITINGFFDGTTLEPTPINYAICEVNP